MANKRNNISIDDRIRLSGIIKVRDKKLELIEHAKNSIRDMDRVIVKLIDDTGQNINCFYTLTGREVNVNRRFNPPVVRVDKNPSIIMNKEESGEELHLSRFFDKLLNGKFE